MQREFQICILLLATICALLLAQNLSIAETPAAAGNSSEAGLLPANSAKFPIREDFNSLAGWNELRFRRIQRATKYEIVAEEPAEATGLGNRYLRAYAENSSSGLMWSSRFDVSTHPNMRWRWKVNNVYSRYTPNKKADDDFPLRINVMFNEPSSGGFFQRAKYALLTRFSRSFSLPGSTLTYVWASTPQAERIIESPYAKTVKMIVVESGSEKAGQWIEERVDIYEDYRKAFGRDPEGSATLGILVDSDDIGETGESMLDYIELEPYSPKN